METDVLPDYVLTTAEKSSLQIDMVSNKRSSGSLPLLKPWLRHCSLHGQRNHCGQRQDYSRCHRPTLENDKLDLKREGDTGAYLGVQIHKDPTSGELILSWPHLTGQIINALLFHLHLASVVQYT